MHSIFIFLIAFLLEFGFRRPVAALTTHQATQTNRAWGISGMATQVDNKNIWRCDDFQERVDKLCATLAEKKGRLIVITDFDRTLSAYTGADGKSCDECHDIVFRHCCPNGRWAKEVDDLWSKTAVAFEGLSSKPPDEQMALFDWWWTSANQLMTSHGLKRAEIEQAVERANTLLRPGCTELFRECAAGGVPVVISSAGLHDVLMALLRRHGALPPIPAAATADSAAGGGVGGGAAVHVHSNRMEFDSDGTLVAFREPLVHCRVKGRTYERLRAELEPHWEEGGKVPCALVLGDGPLDSTVLEGMPGPPVAVRVGFANRPEDDSPQFRGAYDAVITGDGPLHLPLDILRRALAAAAAAPVSAAAAEQPPHPTHP